MSNDETRAVFDDLIAMADDNPEMIARLRVVREYFTNPRFKRWLEQLVWMVNNPDEEPLYQEQEPMAVNDEEDIKQLRDFLGPELANKPGELEFIMDINRRCARNARLRYIATFQEGSYETAPQCGPVIDWDCTDFIRRNRFRADQELENALCALRHETTIKNFVWDHDGVLRKDPAAPEFVRQYTGPCMITLETHDPEENADAK